MYIHSIAKRLTLFANEEAVIEAGLLCMRIMCFSYAFSAFMDCTIAACRGFGRSPRANDSRDHGLARVPRGMDLHDVRPFSHHSIPVPAVHLLVDDRAVAEITGFPVNYKKLRLAG